MRQTSAEPILAQPQLRVSRSAGPVCDDLSLFQEEPQILFFFLARKTFILFEKSKTFPDIFKLGKNLYA